MGAADFSPERGLPTRSDIYPEKNGSGPLIYQMIDAGKRLYLLDHFLPQSADSLKTGYTQQQLDGCYNNEADIWNYFVQNSFQRFARKHFNTIQSIKQFNQCFNRFTVKSTYVSQLILEMLVPKLMLIGVE